MSKRRFHLLRLSHTPGVFRATGSPLASVVKEAHLRVFGGHAHLHFCSTLFILKTEMKAILVSDLRSSVYHQGEARARSSATVAAWSEGQLSMNEYSL